MFKKLVIKWEECGFFGSPVKEKFVVNSNGVSYSKWREELFFDEDPDGLGFENNRLTFKINISDPKFHIKFLELCFAFIKTKDSIVRVAGCDVPMFDIEITFTNGEKVKETLMCDLLSNGMDEFVAALEKFIPEFIDKPLFIGCDENTDLEY